MIIQIWNKVKFTTLLKFGRLIDNSGIILMKKRPAKIKEKQVYYGFEYESIEFKIKSFLKLTPEDRIIEMFDFIEFVLQSRQAYKDKKC